MKYKTYMEAMKARRGNEFTIFKDGCYENVYVYTNIKLQMKGLK